MSDDSRPLVSICMISYNHEKFIKQAIESVLMQNTTFDYELVISDDCSPDNTCNEIQKCLENHPKGDKVRFFPQETNLGAIPNILFVIGKCVGDYVAICEGDDYWISPGKLQKQIDFLEANEDYSMCCHNALTLYENKITKPHLFSSKVNDEDLDMSQIIASWIIPTASMMMRSKYLHNLPKWVGTIYSIDYTLALLMMDAGKIRYMADVSSVYRIDYSGSSMSAVMAKRMEFVFNQQIQLLDYFNNETKNKYNSEVIKKRNHLSEELKFLQLREKSVFLALAVMPKLFLIKMMNKIRKS